MSFTAIHRALGDPPGPITEDMLERAVAEGVPESIDLDWKTKLPKQNEIHNSDFPKDVAAMANAGGGLAVAFRGDRPATVIFHADRGTHFTSTQMAEYADLHGLACSVGRTGVCWDNAQQESYWASLKVEFYNRHIWPTRAEAMTGVADWIERVYNRRRRHSALNMQTPVQFEQTHRQTAQAA